jgi:TP901-1 family phage major tail protein
MPSTGAMNGTAIVLKIGGVTVAKLKSNSISANAAAIDVSNKDSAGWQESIYGQRSGSFDFDGVFAEDGSWGFDEGFAAITGKTTLTARWTSAANGDKYYEATCLLTSISETAPMEDAVTFTGTLQWTGAPTTGVVA